MPDEKPRDERAKRPTPVREALGDAGDAQAGSGDRAEEHAVKWAEEIIDRC